MLVKTIVIHHSASSRDNTTIENINAWHKARGFNKSSLGFFCGYHYVVLGTGKVIQTRRDNEIGCHTIPNDGKLGICLTGNFEKDTPTPEQLNSLETRLTDLKLQYGLTDDDIRGHRQLSQTLCPGKNLQDWLDKYKKVGFLKKQIEKIKELIAKLLSKRS